MKSHCSLIVNELKMHIESAYGVPVKNDEVHSSNIAEGFIAAGNGGGVARENLIF